MINNSHQIIFRLPEKKDAKSVMKLIEDSPPLDANSLYCYLLICTHFAQTSVMAEQHNEICGFISAYLHPERKDTIFVWQVVVKNNVRGQGIASGMLNAILHRAYPVPLRYLETTVNPSNTSSNALFSSLVASLNAGLAKSVLFSADDFGKTSHEEEILYRIGPFDVMQKEKM
jgi:L-2,4-diaminobutyric acid acetyltransferase